jgi:hypothetical protein
MGIMSLTFLNTLRFRRLELQRVDEKIEDLQIFEHVIGLTPE